jgi:hypothetical protein
MKKYNLFLSISIALKNIYLKLKLNIEINKNGNRLIFNKVSFFNFSFHEL